MPKRPILTNNLGISTLTGMAIMQREENNEKHSSTSSCVRYTFFQIKATLVLGMHQFVRIEQENTHLDL